MKFFDWIFGKTERKDDFVPMWREQVNEPLNRLYQQREDRRIENAIRQEAYRLFNEELNKPEIDYGGTVGKQKVWLPIVDTRRMSFYTIYDEKTAKFKDGKIRDLVWAEYKKIKGSFTADTSESESKTT